MLTVDPSQRPRRCEKFRFIWHNAWIIVVVNVYECRSAATLFDTTGVAIRARGHGCICGKPNCEILAIVDAD